MLYIGVIYVSWSDCVTSPFIVVEFLAGDVLWCVLLWCSLAGCLGCKETTQEAMTHQYLGMKDDSIKTVCDLSVYYRLTQMPTVKINLA